MSSNNELIILKEKMYEVWENHCVDNEFNQETSTRLNFSTSLKKAIIFANKYCSDNLVEYGYSVDNSALKTITKGETK